MDSLTGPAVACRACQHSGDKARLKFHRGNPTPQLAIVKWLNKRRAVGTHHTGTTTGFLSSLWSPVLPQQSWHLAAASSVVFSPRWPKPKLFHSIHARLKFHIGNPTPQLAIVKWLNKRPAAGNLGSTAHSNRSSSALSTLVATAPTFLTDASMHNVPTKGLLNSHWHCNQPLQKSPGSKICSFQEVFVGDIGQQPKVVLQRSELCSCYLRALANPQASFAELNILHLKTTSSRASGQIGSSIVWITITSM